MRGLNSHKLQICREIHISIYTVISLWLFEIGNFIHKKIFLVITNFMSGNHYILLLVLQYSVQVSLAICGGYIPHKSKTVNTKSCILSLNKAKLD